MASVERIRELEAELSELRSSRSYRIGHRLVTVGTRLLPGHLIQRLRATDVDTRNRNTEVPISQPASHRSLPIQPAVGVHPSADAPRLGVLILETTEEDALHALERILEAQLLEQCVQLLPIVDVDIYAQIRRSGLVLERIMPRAEWESATEIPYGEYLAVQLDWLQRAYNLQSFIVDLSGATSLDVLTGLVQAFPKLRDR